MVCNVCLVYVQIYIVFGGGLSSSVMRSVGVFNLKMMRILRFLYSGLFVIIVDGFL